MSGLIGFLFAWVAAFRLGEWVWFDRDPDDLSTGLFFAALAAIAFVIARGEP